VCGRLEGPAVFSPLSLFFTLSSRTASCADALRDLLFAWLSSFVFILYAVIPNEASCADALRDLLFAFAFADIIATVQFSDHTEGTLEVSSVHVCFSTHSRSALWLRVFPIK
jgi:hypothetical protein